MKSFPSALALSLLLSAVAAQAEPAAPAETTAPAEMTPEEARAALNKRMAEAAKAQNASQKQSYDDAVRARNEQFAQAQAAYEAEKARLTREHEEAMARWRADVEACKKGDKSKCAK